MTRHGGASPPGSHREHRHIKVYMSMIENVLRALFCEKNGFNMGVNGRVLGRFSFRSKSPQKGRGHLKHDFRLTERLLPDSTMTYRGRSDGLVVESDRKKSITFK